MQSKEEYMAFRIPSDQVRNLQQIEAVVAGPDGANRLYTVTAQVGSGLTTILQASGAQVSSETFTVLVGPVFTRRQFVRAIGTSSLTGAGMNCQSSPMSAAWHVTDADADWDDESGQVELKVSVTVSGAGLNTVAQLLGFGFQVTILAEI
jgi:hypothetical protein